MTASNDTSKSGIYSITNTLNQHAYIGSSNNIRLRWNGHRAKLRGNKHANPHLQSAWNAYGEGVFQFVILEYCTIDQLSFREQYYIDTMHPVYNIAQYADPIERLRNPSDETRKRMSDAKRGRKLSDEHKRKLVRSGEDNHNFGKPLSNETKLKISQTLKGRKLPESVRQKMSIAFKGRVFSDEHRQKLSDAGKGREMHPQTKAKLLQANLGKKQSAEQVDKRIDSRRRDFVVTSPDGTEYLVHGLLQFCKDHKLNCSHMNSVARGKLPHHKQWKCRYA